MARYQIKKRGFFSLDMAAFCDVGFVILLFFMLTQWRGKEYLNTQVDAPSVENGTPFCSMNDGYDFTVVFTRGKKCFIELRYDSAIRKAVLFKMGKLKGAAFTRQEAEKFVTIDRFGVSVAALKSLIKGYTSAKDILVQPGIPVNNNNDNELTEWLEAVRQVTREERGRDMRVSILGDKELPYPYISMLTDNLQRHGVNRFSLLTQYYHLGAHHSYTVYP